MCEGLVVCEGSKVSPFKKISEMAYSQVEGEELAFESPVLFSGGQSFWLKKANGTDFLSTDW